MHTLIHQADRLLKGRNFEYAFCGGMAIDLFLGRETRRHGDVDVSIYWPDRDAVLAYMQSAGFEVYEMLGGRQGASHYRPAGPAQGETKFLLLHGGLRVGGME